MSEQLTFQRIRDRQHFVFEGQTFKKLDAWFARKLYGFDKPIRFTPTTPVALPARRNDKGGG